MVFKNQCDKTFSFRRCTSKINFLITMYSGTIKTKDFAAENAKIKTMEFVRKFSATRFESFLINIKI